MAIMLWAGPVITQIAALWCVQALCLALVHTSRARRMVSLTPSLPIQAVIVVLRSLILLVEWFTMLCHALRSGHQIEICSLPFPMMRLIQHLRQTTINRAIFHNHTSFHTVNLSKQAIYFVIWLFLSIFVRSYKQPNAVRTTYRLCR